MLKIIYQDDALLVIDKPAGLVSDRSKTQQGQTLEELLAEKYHDLPPRSGIVHRLDKDTSGLLLVAKTDQAFENLQAQFKERKVKKEYLALVHGWVEKPGRVEGSIGRNPKKREKFSVLLDGKEAVTEYIPVEKFEWRKLKNMHYGHFTLLQCHPLTGRTHQIRVHLKYINHPIVADEKYVGRKMYPLDKRWCPRQFLHARKIGFKHPKSGEWMEFESELPEDLNQSLKLLRS